MQDVKAVQKAVHKGGVEAGDEVLVRRSRLSSRLIDIRKKKGLADYKAYIAHVPKSERTSKHPRLTRPTAPRAAGKARSASGHSTFTTLPTVSPNHDNRFYPFYFSPRRRSSRRVTRPPEPPALLLSGFGVGAVVGAKFWVGF